MIAALAALLACTSAQAADNPQASLAWRLDFGAGAPHAGYDLSLGYRGAEHFAPLSQALKLSVDGGRTITTIVGVPFAARSFRSDDTAGGAEAVAGESPWYARSWVLWTVGGLAATAALIGSAGSNESNPDGGPTDANTCVGPGISPDHIDADCVSGP